jgi:hypothetical protein
MEECGSADWQDIREYIRDTVEAVVLVLAGEVWQSCTIQKKTPVGLPTGGESKKEEQTISPSQ